VPQACSLLCSAAQVTDYSLVFEAGPRLFTANSHKETP
jgi:hypothetical protein